MLMPPFNKIHWDIFIIFIVEIMIPLAMKSSFLGWETSLINLLAVIGYWAGCFDAVLTL